MIFEKAHFFQELYSKGKFITFLHPYKSYRLKILLKVITIIKINK